WKEVDVNEEKGPLKDGESAIFRTHVSVSNEDLASLKANLAFGMIDDEGWIYVNGQLVGESHNWRSSPQFDILKFIHAGDNTIAVAIKNRDDVGGLNKCASFEFEKKLIAAEWQRSVFNVLAEVIVQAKKNAE